MNAFTTHHEEILPTGRQRTQRCPCSQRRAERHDTSKAALHTYPRTCQLDAVLKKMLLGDLEGPTKANDEDALPEIANGVGPGLTAHSTVLYNRKRAARSASWP